MSAKSGEATASRDEARRARVEAYLAGHGERGPVARVVRLGGGACQENLRVELEGRVLVVRSDARQSLPGSIDRRAEAEVVRAAADAGVRTPRPLYAGLGAVREGAHAYFMHWTEGEGRGPKVVSDPSLARAREGLVGELGRQLARVHSVTPRAATPSLLEVLGPPPARPVDAALSFTRAMLDLLPEKSLPLELGFAWLDAHRPPDEAACLVHGDFRVGNFLVDSHGLTAILDWEFAHWGVASEDLGWLSVRAWRFGRDRAPVGGLGQRAELYAAYEAERARLSGHAQPIDPAAVHWWEILGNVRWGAGSILQGERFLLGLSRDLELLAIPRRAVEMEREALRLIERGPERVGEACAWRGGGT